MGAARRVIVIAFIGMRQLSIGKCRIDSSAEDLRRGYGGHFLAAHGASELDRLESRGQLGPGYHGCERVENVMLCALGYWVGERSLVSLAHIAGERGHHRA